MRREKKYYPESIHLHSIAGACALAAHVGFCCLVRPEYCTGGLFRLLMIYLYGLWFQFNFLEDQSSIQDFCKWLSIYPEAISQTGFLCPEIQTLRRTVWPKIVYSPFKLHTG